MELSRIFDGIEVLKERGNPPRSVPGISCDSRKVRRGELFFALPGSRTDGTLFVREALRRGAAGVVTQGWPLGIAAGSRRYVVRVRDAVRTLGVAAANFYRHPARSLIVVGVTGTNGKTTTTYFLESILQGAGWKTGVIGTINYRLGGKVLSAAPNTTPIALDMQRLLDRIRRQGASAVVMEVSSHALALGRVRDVEYDGAVFTNLHRDHLDFHKTPENYFRAKAVLFRMLKAGTKPGRFAVLNADDPASRRLEAIVKKNVRVRTYGFSRASGCAARYVEATLAATRFEIRVGGDRLPVRLRLVGRHNVLNALAAAASALELGLPLRDAVLGLEALEGVPGRLERVPNRKGLHVFVDYAHTDSALEMVLRLIHDLPHQKIYTVFGCGGDRDRSKRGPMGRSAVHWSDLSFVTSDNPRTEDPMRILRDIEEGIRGTGRNNYRMLPDRREAIHAAIRSARPGDTVLIAGKGHETYQLFKDRTLHFDDREIAREALGMRSGR